MNQVKYLIHDVEQFKIAFYLNLLPPISEWDAAQFLLDTDLTLMSLRGVTPAEGVQRAQEFLDRWHKYFDEVTEA